LEFASSEEITHALSKEGLAGAMYPNYEPRVEQVQMALAIRDAQAEGRHVAVEAGTGVGKSLAYLVSLALLAVRNGITVGVATKTNTLTDQLMYKELPALAAAMAAAMAEQTPVGTDAHNREPGDSDITDGSEEPSQQNTPLRFTALKGYDHYPCLRKIDSQLRTPVVDRVALAQVVAWVSQSSWGELSGMNVALFGADRAQVAANANDCTKRKCRHYGNCYLHGVRRRADSSHIVVTNQALLFRNTVADGGILPPVRYWVIDEAQGAEQEARRQLARAFDERELGATIKLVVSGHAGVLDRLLKKMDGFSEGDVAEIEEAATNTRRELERAQVLAETFFSYARDLSKQAPQRNGAYSSEKTGLTLWINDELRQTGAWGALEHVGGTLYTALDEALKAGVLLLRRFTAAAEGQTPNELADFSGLLFGLRDLAESLALAVSEPEENRVYSLVLARERRGVQTASLTMQQLSVGEAIAEDLLSTARSIVFTSATLAVGESFERFARGVGLTSLPDERWESVRLASSYDLPRQMRIFVPLDMPGPAERGYREALEALLESVHREMRGGVLTLFTNRRDMSGCYDNLREKFRSEGIELLSQSSPTNTKTLLEHFVADPATSLFATKSFWEGFDASGDTLRCVIIPKLPFGRPDDPLACERTRVEGRGAWAHYDLPDAIIELKQAVGRLIRSSTDRGCVILADSRIVTKGYGKRVVESLPVKPEFLTVSDIITEIHENY
jgi:ATP-dependent DNA helicase DinG